MPLSRQSIQARLDLPDDDPHRIVITPLGSKPIQPCTVDIRLGGSLKRWRRPYGYTWGEEPPPTCLDPREDNSRFLESLDTDQYVLRRRDFILYETMEYLEVPTDLVAMIDGTSSKGRLGYQIHSTAGYIDPGFRGTITLEVSNNNDAFDLLLYKGMYIAQLTFLSLDEATNMGYGHPDLKSRYAGQSGATGPLPERW